jgi:hypothetical protein
MPLFMLPIYPWILVKVRKAQTQELHPVLAERGSLDYERGLSGYNTESRTVHHRR